MSLRTKFFIANVLMSIGVAPLAYCVIWAVSILASTPARRVILPSVDPIGMIGLSIMSFILALAVAGTSAALSWDLARQNPDSRSRTALAFRLMTAALLISPFLLSSLSNLL